MRMSSTFSYFSCCAAASAGLLLLLPRRLLTRLPTSQLRLRLLTPPPLPLLSYMCYGFHSSATSRRWSDFLLLSLPLLLFLPELGILQNSLGNAAASPSKTRLTAPTPFATAVAAGYSTVGTAVLSSTAPTGLALSPLGAATAAAAAHTSATARAAPCRCIPALGAAQQRLSLFYVATPPWGVRTPGAGASSAARYPPLRNVPAEAQHQLLRQQRQLRLQQQQLHVQQHEGEKLPQPVTQLLPALPLASELVGRSPQRQREQSAAAGGWQDQLKLDRRRRGLVVGEEGIAATRAAAAEALQRFTALLTKEMKLAVAALRKFPQQLPPLHRALLQLSLSRNKKLTQDRCSRTRIKQRHQQLQVLQEHHRERLRKQQQQPRQTPNRAQRQPQDELLRQLQVRPELDLSQQQLVGLQQEEVEDLQQLQEGVHQQQEHKLLSSGGNSTSRQANAVEAQQALRGRGREVQEREQQLLFEKEKHLLQGKEKLPSLARVYEDLRALYIELVSQGKAHAAQVRRCTRSSQVEQRYKEGVHALRKAVSLRSDALLNYRLFSSYIHLHAQQRCSLHRLTPQLPHLLLVGGPNVGKSSLFIALAAANQYVRQSSRLELRQATAQAQAAVAARSATAGEAGGPSVKALTTGRASVRAAASDLPATAATASVSAAAAEKDAQTRAGEDVRPSGRWDLLDTWRLERRAVAVGRAFAFHTAAAADAEGATAAAAGDMADVRFDGAADPAARAAEAAAAAAVAEPYAFSTQGLVVAKLFERKRRGVGSGDAFASLQTAALPTYRSVGQLIDAPPLLLRTEGEDDRNVFEKVTLCVLSHLPCGVLFLFDASGLPRRQLTDRQLQMLQQQLISSDTLLPEVQRLLDEEEQQGEKEEEGDAPREHGLPAAAAITSRSFLANNLGASLQEGCQTGATAEENVARFKCINNNSSNGAGCSVVSGSIAVGGRSGQRTVKKGKTNRGRCPLNLLQQLALRNQLRQRFPKRPWIDIVAKADLLNAAQLQTARALLPSCLLLSTHRSVDSILQVQRHARLLLLQLGQIAEQRTASVEQERLLKQQCDRQKLQQMEQQRIHEALRFYAESASEAAKCDGA